MAKQKLNAKTRLLNSLAKGTLTTSQARKRFGISNVSARIADLRDDGVNIKTNMKIGTNGRRSYFYSLNA